MPASAWVANGVLDYLFNSQALAQPSAWYVQLHTADPGDDGVGSESTAFSSRVQCTDWTSASGKTLSNNAAVLFSNASGGETITHVSIFDAATSGNCLGYASLTASKTVSSGDDLNFAIGEIDISIG